MAIKNGTKLFIAFMLAPEAADRLQQYTACIHERWAPYNSQ